MILLDTNVVSEPLRPAPDARVIEWIDAQAMQNGWASVSGRGVQPIAAWSLTDLYSQPRSVTHGANRWRK